MTRRMERVAEEIREETARIIGGRLKDPRIGFVTVTRVSVTPDLRLARIYVGVLGDETQRKKTIDALHQATGFVRREVSRALRLRHSPEIRFEYDVGLDAAVRVAELIDLAHAQDPDVGEDDG
jgi:ribosome-binding factor A